MQETESDEIAICMICSKQMDIAHLPPFTKIACVGCNEQFHVKRRFGQYVLQRKQGSGGMSIVYAASENNLGREVAIKILNDSSSICEDRIKQFEQEARIMALLSHPNIVTIYTVGENFERYYIAMELISGMSMEEIFNESGKMEQEALLPLMRGVVSGLYAAHEKGLLHRDIKPGNILIDNRGVARIVDFGLALVTKGGKVKADEVWATAYYVPPETLNQQEEDFRSDIYALCATMYHMLSGEPPFDSKTKCTKELAEIKKSITPLGEKCPELNPVVCAIVDKGMSYDSDQRFSSYDQLHECLQYAEDNIGNDDVGLPTVLLPAKRSWKDWKIQLPLVASVVAIVVLGLGAGAFVYKDRIFAFEDEVSSADFVIEDRELKKKVDSGYLSLKKSIVSGDYLSAMDEAYHLSHLEGHPEPSSVFCDMHCYIAALLTGDETMYDGTHTELEDYVEGLAEASEEIVSSRVDYLGRDKVALLLFATALYDAEHGRFNEAEAEFKKFIDPDFMRNNTHRDGRNFQIINHYKKIARNYLVDIQMIKKMKSLKEAAGNTIQKRKQLGVVQAYKGKTKLSTFSQVKENTLARLK
ncbi:serine/threonine protein kinase [Akkermansiaceae bacterium]|nr:serine/threonine protein kinase [Akkermansiaceae bacterium]